MRRSVREGWPGLRLPPLLLDGPPGIGKSMLLRVLVQRLRRTLRTVTLGAGDIAMIGAEVLDLLRAREGSSS